MGEHTSRSRAFAVEGDRGDDFGFSVALDGSTALVGAPGEAYAFSNV